MTSMGGGESGWQGGNPRMEGLIWQTEGAAAGRSLST